VLIAREESSLSDLMFESEIECELVGPERASFILELCFRMRGGVHRVGYLKQDRKGGEGDGGSKDKAGLCRHTRSGACLSGCW
jgi:hypothetical protein